MDSTVIWYLIIAVIILLILVATAYVLHSGLLYQIEVDAGKPPIDNVIVAYKFKRGPYKECGKIFGEVHGLAPKQRTIGVYYDDPKEVPADKLRYAVGCILAEGTDKPDPHLEEKLTKSGFQLVHFPRVTNVVRSKFIFNTYLSILLSVYRVYPRIITFVEEQGLNIHIIMEIYEGNTIKYMAPLSNHEEFYVPEATLHEEEDKD